MIKNIFDENVLTDSMLNGIRDAIAHDLKIRLKRFVEEELEKLTTEVAIEVTKRFHGVMTERLIPDGFQKGIRLELMLSPIKKTGEYIVETETKVREKE